MQGKRESGLFVALNEGFFARSELKAIKTFCSNSETFKTMQKNSFSGDFKRKQELILAIKAANKFSEMLPLIDKFDPVEKKSVATKALFKTVVFLGSYVNADADFVYQLSTLKNEIIYYAVEHGYELTYRQVISHGV